MKTQITIAPPYFITSANNHHLLFISLVFITACSIFKEKSFFQADSLKQKKVRQEINTESLTTSEVVSLYTSTDSADKQTLAEIFPKGEFTYSLADGFRGEAHSVGIRERVQQTRQQSGSDRQAQTSKLQRHMEESEKLRIETRLKEKELKTQNISLFYGGGCAMILLLLFFWWRFKIRTRTN
jgi:hypothetical protein